jgi:hypothetical protein
MLFYTYIESQTELSAYQQSLKFLKKKTKYLYFRKQVSSKEKLDRAQRKIGIHKGIFNLFSD